MPAVISMSAYRPKAEQKAAFEQLMKDHVVALRQAGLATARKSVLLESREGIFVELFEWTSPDAAGKAHESPIVRATWSRFEALCDRVPLNSVADFAGPHAGFVARDDLAG